MEKLSRRGLLSGVSVATVAAVSGCSQLDTENAESDPDEDRSGGSGPLQILGRLWSTWESGNVDAYQELFHSDSPERQKEYWNDDQYWAEFGPREGVDWTIENREVIDRTETRATVRDVYVWRPPDEPTVRITDRLDFRTEGGEWRVWEFDGQDVEELGGGSGPNEDSSGGGGSGPDEGQEDTGSAQFETTVEHADTMIVGREETVTVSVENVGEKAGNSDVMLKLHTVEDTQEISLASGQSTEFTFEFVVPNNPGRYNLRVATVAAEEVVRNSVSIINPEDAFELTEVINGEWSCYEVSQFKELESVDWEFEITNSAGIELGGEQVVLEIRAYDGAGRTVGTFNSRGTAPSPNSPSVFRTTKDDMPEESCDYVESIVEGTNEDNGGLSVNDAQW